MILFLIIVGVASLVLIPVAYLIGLFNIKKRTEFSFGFARLCLCVLKFLSGADIIYKGLEYLPGKNESVVFIGHHRSFFDIILFYPLLKGVTGFAVKEEIKYWPVVGWWLNLVNCIFIDRNHSRKGLASILKGIEYIKAGSSMMIFPEGKRSKEELVLLEFRHGSFKLATKPKVKLIPIAYNNTGGVFENHVPFVKKAKVCIEICKPIDTAALTKEETAALPETVKGIIQETINRNAALIPNTRP